MTFKAQDHLDGCSFLKCEDHGWRRGPAGDLRGAECHCPFCMSEKIEILLAAVDAVRANSAPDAVSLSLHNRIRAFFVITRQAIDDVSTRENISEACNRLRIPPPSHL